MSGAVGRVRDRTRLAFPRTGRIPLFLIGGEAKPLGGPPAELSWKQPPECSTGVGSGAWSAPDESPEASCRATPRLTLARTLAPDP